MSKRDELRAAQIAISTALAQHASYAHRASTAVVNILNDEVDRITRALTAELSERLEDLTQAELDAFVSGKYTTSRLKALKAEIDGWGKALAQAIDSEWVASATALAGFEAAYVADLMGKALDDLPKVTLKPKDLFERALQTPVMGQHIQDMARSLAPKHVDRVYSLVRNGIASGQSNGEIIRALRGTKALNYKDGLTHSVKNDVETFVRTARNHVSNVASEQMWRELGVTHVKRLAQLEGRTCLVAGELVNTPSGPQAIETLVAGDLVVGGSGLPRRITGTMSNTTNKLCRVRLSNGETIVCTPDHLAWDGENWVEIGSLKAGHKLPETL